MIIELDRGLGTLRTTTRDGKVSSDIQLGVEQREVSFEHNSCDTSQAGGLIRYTFGASEKNS